MPSREDYFARWAALHGGYPPGDSVMVGGWLGLVYRCARPFAAARVHPDVLTWLGLVAGGLAVWAAAVGGGWLWVAAGLVALAGLLDNLDGAVAVLTGRTSAWGQVLDATVDRVGDGLFLVSLWVVGAPAAVCVLAAAAAGLLEYVRARATVAGMADVGVVTLAERPTRVIVTAAFLAAAATQGEAAGQWVGAGAWVFLIASLVGLAQIVIVARRRLLDGEGG